MKIPKKFRFFFLREDDNAEEKSDKSENTETIQESSVIESNETYSDEIRIALYWITLHLKYQKCEIFPHFFVTSCFQGKFQTINYSKFVRTEFENDE